MRLEVDGPALDHEHRLEDARVGVGRSRRPLGPRCDGLARLAGSAGHEPSSAPMAASSGRALSKHSSSSWSGSESATTPPPTPSQTFPPPISKVRIATFSSRPDKGLAIPMAPVYTSRAVVFERGHELHRPDLGRPGDRAWRERGPQQSASDTPSDSSPVTSETRCQTPGCSSARHSSGTATLP